MLFWDAEVSIVMGVPQNGWFIMETPIKMNDLDMISLYILYITVYKKATNN